MLRIPFKICVFLLLAAASVSPTAAGYAQQDTSIFSQPIQLDSFVIRSDFDVNAFIRRVRTDTTFFKAFKNMRLVPYTAWNDITILWKNNEIVASLKSKTRQVIEKGCRSTRVIEEHTTGDFYKRNGDYRYYTAKLYDHIFFAKEPVCNETDIVAHDMDTRGKGELEKSEYQLKQLIFNPGSRVAGVPFMAARESIFDAGEAEKYTFKIEQKLYDGEKCYVFRITPKHGYEHKTLFNELTTWFRQSDYSIIARDYSLSYSNLIYDFDVTMKVRIRRIGDKLYPTFISYDGNWHIISKKRERAKFTIDIAY